MDLTGKTVVVAGGFGVLGAETAALAARAGAKTAALGRGEPRGAPGVLAVRTADLADDAAAREALGRVAAAFGRIDVLVNAAGAFEWRPVEAADADLWLSLFRANVLTAACVSRAALPHMGPGSAIVNVAAAAAGRAAAGMGPYAAAKAGVLRLTEALAAELEPRGVRAFSVSPAVIDTPRNRADMPDADVSAWISPAALAEAIFGLALGDRPSGFDLRIGG